MPYITSVERLAFEQGMKIGMEEWREGMLLAIETALEVKFGALDIAVISEVRAINDIDVLYTICQALRTTNSLDELRRLWTK